MTYLESLAVGDKCRIVYMSGDGLRVSKPSPVQRVTATTLLVRGVRFHRSNGRGFRRVDFLYHIVDPGDKWFIRPPHDDD